VTNADEDSAQSHADEPSPPDESTLWLVSFGDDDDREMRSPEIAQALRRGEIGADTIVWREGLPEWVALGTIPMLARLLVTSGETRAAPAAVLGKIPLVQREERAMPGPAAATPVAVPNPSAPVTGAGGAMPGTAGRSAMATISGVGEPTPTVPDAKAVEHAAPPPAWKGRTRIGLPKMETGAQEPSAKPPMASATGTPLPGVGTPSPAAAKLASATGTPLPGAGATAKAGAATGTPLPRAAKATPPTTSDVTSKSVSAGGRPPAAASASKAALGTLEPKRPESRAIEPKPGAKPPTGATKPGGAAAPRTSVPKAAPVPTPKAADVRSTKPADAQAEPPKAAVPASSPKAAEPVSAPDASSSAVGAARDVGGATPSEPEPPTLPEATFARSQEPPKTATLPEPPKVVASPEPPKASRSPEPPKAVASPEPPKTATLPEPPKVAASPEPPKTSQSPEPPKTQSLGPSRKDAPKGPPPRHRDAAPPGPRRASPKPDAPAAKTGAAYIWEDADSDAMSVDPESVRPPPPVHAIAEARAQAPGFKKKSAPKPPSPPKRTSSIPVAVETDEPTIPIPTALPVMDDAANADETTPPRIAQLAIPAVEEFARTPAPELDTTPTVPREAKSKPAPRATPKPPAVATVASTPPSQEKRRSLFPFVLLGAAAAAVALTFALKKQPPAEPVSASEPRSTTPAEPTNAQVTPPPTAEPEATQAASAELPAPSAEPAATAATAVPATPAPEATATAKATPTTTSVATPKPAATPNTESASKPASTPKPAPTEKPDKPVAAAPAQPQVSDVGGDFDKAAASSALSSAAGVASGCRKAGDPTGVAVVHVTFANSGRATRALVEGPPFAGTATGGCIADALRNAKVPPYGGDRVTVTKRVVIQ
jgi:hypothetical protein